RPTKSIGEELATEQRSRRPAHLVCSQAPSPRVSGLVRMDDVPIRIFIVFWVDVVFWVSIMRTSSALRRLSRKSVGGGGRGCGRWFGVLCPGESRGGCKKDLRAA